MSKVNSGQFSSEHQPKKRRGKSKKNQLLAAMDKRGMTETEFWDDVLTLAKEGEMSAVSLVAQRLQPAFKPETRPIDPGLLDSSWAELSNGSRIAVVSYLMAIGQISAENCLALTKSLNDGASLTVDYYDKLFDVREFEDVGDRQRLDTRKNLYELSTAFTADIKRDLEQLQEAIQSHDNDEDSDDPVVEDQDDSDPNEEPLVSVSLHDLVRGSEAAVDTDNTDNTNDNTGGNQSSER